MIIEKGVEMIGLCENLNKILPIIEAAFGMFGNDVIVSAAKWGRDRRRTAHESGHALDVRLPAFHEPETIALLTDALGLNFTVRRVIGNLHIEYTPLSIFPMNHRKRRPHVEHV